MYTVRDKRCKERNVHENHSIVLISRFIIHYKNNQPQLRLHFLQSKQLNTAHLFPALRKYAIDHHRILLMNSINFFIRFRFTKILQGTRVSIRLSRLRYLLFMEI